MTGNTEYRVVWKREGTARRYGHHWQSRDAAERHALRLQGRIAEAKGHDAEDLLCCDGFNGGYPCPCDGKTWGEWEDETTAEWAPLTLLRIESREVFDWGVVSTGA